MDREELHEALKRGPVAVTMNDGNRYVIPSLEMAVVSDLSASVASIRQAGPWNRSSRWCHEDIPFISDSGLAAFIVEEPMIKSKLVNRPCVLALGTLEFS